MASIGTMFPDLIGKAVLDLGCGYGRHRKYATYRGVVSVLGIDQIPEKMRRPMMLLVRVSKAPTMPH